MRPLWYYRALLRHHWRMWRYDRNLRRLAAEENRVSVALMEESASDWPEEVERLCPTRGETTTEAP